MFAKPTHDQAMALAAVFQACHLVDKLANTGEASTDEMEVCISALLNQDPDSLIDLYGSEQNLQTGVAAMTLLLGEHKGNDVFSSVILVYGISILSIERQLDSRPVMLKILPRASIARLARPSTFLLFTTMCLPILPRCINRRSAHCASVFRSRAIPFIYSSPVLPSAFAACCLPLSGAPFSGVN